MDYVRYNKDLKAKKNKEEYDRVFYSISQDMKNMSIIEYIAARIKKRKLEKKQTEELSEIEKETDAFNLGQCFKINYGMLTLPGSTYTAEYHYYMYDYATVTTFNGKIQSLQPIAEIETVVEYLGYGHFRDLSTGLVFLGVATPDKREDDYSAWKTRYFHSVDEIKKYPISLALNCYDTDKEVDRTQATEIISRNIVRRDEIHKCLSDAQRECLENLRQELTYPSRRGIFPKEKNDAPKTM